MNIYTDNRLFHLFNKVCTYSPNRFGSDRYSANIHTVPFYFYPTGRNEHT